MTKAEVLEKLPKSLRDDVVYEPWPDVHTHTTESRTEQVITIRGVYKPVPVKTRGQEIAEKYCGSHPNYSCVVKGLARAIDAAIAETKEAAAKVCENEAAAWGCENTATASSHRVSAHKCAYAIRAMKQ